MDLGRINLHRSSHDVGPGPRREVVSSGWLPHEAMPYEGERDRVAIAFNAQAQTTGGSPGLPLGTG